MALLLILGATVAFVLVLLVRNATQPGLGSIPGPFTAKFSNIWRVWQIYRNRFSNEISKLHAKHGKVVRIGPNVVSVSDVRAIDGILGVRSDFRKVGGFTDTSIRW